MEFDGILSHFHFSPYRGHFGVTKTSQKILHSSFYWPTLFRDCFENVKKYDRCQRIGNIAKRDEMPLQGLLEVEIFDVWGIDFMGPIPAFQWKFVHTCGS